MKAVALIVLVVAVMTSLLVTVQCRDIHVSPTGQNEPDCGTQEQPCLTILFAVAQANQSDHVLLSNTTFVEEQTISVTKENITIIGSIDMKSQIHCGVAPCIAVRAAMTTIQRITFVGEVRMQDGLETAIIEVVAVRPSETLVQAIRTGKLEQDNNILTVTIDECEFAPTLVGHLAQLFYFSDLPQPHAGVVLKNNIIEADTLQWLVVRASDISVTDCAFAGSGEAMRKGFEDPISISNIACHNQSLCTALFNNVSISNMVLFSDHLLSMKGAGHGENQFTMTGCSFEHIVLTASNAMLLITSSFQIKDSTIANNNARAMLRSHSTTDTAQLSLQNVQVMNNKGGDVIALSDCDNIEVIDCVFHNNSGGSSLILLDSASAVISNATFSDNAPGESNVVFVTIADPDHDSYSTTFKNCEFSKNTGTPIGIFNVAESNMTVDLSGTRFSLNTVRYSAGAIMIRGDRVNVQLSACNFVDNQGASDRASVYCEQPENGTTTVHVSGGTSTFEDNYPHDIYSPHPDGTCIFDCDDSNPFCPIFGGVRTWTIVALVAIGVALCLMVAVVVLGVLITKLKRARHLSKYDIVQ